MGKLMDTEKQFELFEQGETEQGEPVPEIDYSKRPGAVFNGKIWVSDEDLAF